MTLENEHAGDLLIPENEHERLQAVYRYQILDTPPDGTFDRVAALAARYFDVPIATVSIVDHDRVWFKATQGLDMGEIGRDPGLCASVICQDSPYVVTDALSDPRTLDNPLVRGELGLRFYAAAPIVTVDGYNLGTVNVMDQHPRSVTSAELAMLADLAGVVADEMELRLATRQAVERERSERVQAERLIDVLQQRLLPQEAPAVPGLEIATHYRPVSPWLDAGGDFYDVFDLDDGHWALAIGDVCGKGPEAAAVTGEIRHMLRALARMASRPSEVLSRLNDVLVREELDPTAPGERFCTACYARVDVVPSPIEVTVCCAGHPLPLVRRADGRVEQIGQPGQLLGPLDQVELTEETVGLAPGELLLLYTDGAVEQRGVSLAVGERALERALATAPCGDAEAALEHVRDTVERQYESMGDDIALMLIRVPSA